MCLHFPALICSFCAPAKFEMKMGALKCVSPIVNNVKLKAENVERRNNFTEVIRKGRTERSVLRSLPKVCLGRGSERSPNSGVFREVLCLNCFCD